MATQASPTFGDLLRRYRMAAGLTQEELAERAALSVRAISDLERGLKQAPRRYTVQAISRALDLQDRDQAALQATVGRRRGPASPPAQSETAARLPVPPTPFVGRVREVTEVAALLRGEEVRLLTLTGPGGIGKTRLAAQAARAALDAFPAGAAFVSLAALADAQLVPAAIAAGLEVTEASGQPILKRVAEHLHDKRLLLVLDSYEHLLEATGVLSRLLADCPQLTILVTSRAVLHLAAEHEYLVPPLPTPVPGHVPDLDALVHYDSVKLFLQRARAVKPSFQIDHENAADVAEICARLDGLPLAIELAAARLRLFPPHALLGRLQSSLGVLTGGATDVPSRQRTLRSAIDWSYSLLSAAEQALFARLSVFIGGCAFEAAEAVCNAGGQMDLLEGIASLVEKSMLQQEGEEEPRFAMLQTIREYAAEKLDERGEGESLRTAHLNWFLQLAEQAEPQLRGADQTVWLRRLTREHANLLAALHWARESGDPEAGLRLATYLWRFWSTRGLYTEGRSQLEALLAIAPGAEPHVPPLLQAKALNQLARFADRQGDLDRAMALATESLALNRAAGDTAGIAAALSTLGGALRQKGDYKEATVILEECLALRRELGDAARVASTLNSLGGAARWQGQYDRAESLFQEALQLYGEQGDTAGIAHMLFRLGDIRLDQRDFAGARQLYEQSLAMRGDLEDREGIGFVLNGLALLTHAQGDDERALDFAERSLSLFREVGARRQISCMLDTLARIELELGDVEDAAASYRESLVLALAAGAKELVPYGLEGLGRIAARRGAPERGARLYGAGAALRDSLNTPPDGHERAPYERAVDEIRQVLGPSSFAAAWEAGRSLPVERAAAEALEDAVSRWDQGARSAERA